MSVSISDLLDDLVTIPSSVELDNDDISVLSHATTGTRDRIGSCILTIFPPDTDKKWLLPTTYYTDTSHIEYWCGQFETTPTTNKQHAHIFVKWTHKRRPKFSSLANLIKEVVGTAGDIKQSKSQSNDSRQSAINYCLKPDTRTPGNDMQFIWPHCKTPISFDQALWDKRKTPEPRATKADLDEERREWIESKPKSWNWDQLVHENEDSKKLLCTCSWGAKYHAGRHAETPRRKIENVVILYGAGGTGKTTLAHSWDMRDDEDVDERYYRRNPDDGQFWGGSRTAYRGQRIIHLEEFCGSEKIAKFKEICDVGKPGPPVNVKNGGVMLNHDTVLITSNHHPAAWYRHHWEQDQKQFHPFWRRVTQVWFYPSHRPDGSLNIPDSDNEPYCVDQTDDWKTLSGDYKACTAHAAEHWPLKELDGGGTSPTFNPPNESINEFHDYCRTGRWRSS